MVLKRKLKSKSMKNLIISIKHYGVRLALALSLLGMCTACSDLLQADNPNNLLEEDLKDPRSVLPMVNGVQASLTRAVANIIAPYATASDELSWIGSRDAWQQLQFGNFNNPNNEFTDAAFFFVGEARWWSDDVIKRIEAFEASGLLLSGDEVQLARAYLYGAIIYTVIADMFDDFVIDSDKSEAAPPVGPENMASLYDRAIDYLNKGRAIAGISADLDAAFVGMLARVYHARALWTKLNPVNLSNPLVNDPDAIKFAQEALSKMAADYKFVLATDPTTPDVVGELDIGQQVNQRLEMRLSNDYIIPDAENKRVANLTDGDPATSISLLDPIDNIADPALYDAVLSFSTQAQFVDFTIVSAREMHLILAEAALAQQDEASFTTQINELRALNPKLSAYTGQVDAQSLLQHARRVNLFLQGRRIADHYRFQDPATDWQPNSDAILNPGSFFPITITEIRANPFIN